MNDKIVAFHVVSIIVSPVFVLHTSLDLNEDKTNILLLLTSSLGETIAKKPISWIGEKIVASTTHNFFTCVQHKTRIIAAARAEGVLITFNRVERGAFLMSWHVETECNFEFNLEEVTEGQSRRNKLGNVKLPCGNIVSKPEASISWQTVSLAVGRTIADWHFRYKEVTECVLVYFGANRRKRFGWLGNLAICHRSASENYLVICRTALNLNLQSNALDV